MRRSSMGQFEDGSSIAEAVQKHLNREEIGEAVWEFALAHPHVMIHIALLQMPAWQIPPEVADEILRCAICRPFIEMNQELKARLLELSERA